MRIFQPLIDKIHDPSFMKKTSGALIVFFSIWTILCAIPGTIFFWLAQQVSYVSFVSHLALVLSLIPAYAAYGVEKRQQEENNADMNKVEKKVDEVHEEVIECD